jgi:hypothetical protein
MITRTYPYGTKKNVTVLNVTQGMSSVVTVVCKQDGTDQEFFLVMTKRDKGAEAKPGDRGVITFKAGGPKGGYWDYAAREVGELFP